MTNYVTLPIPTAKPPVQHVERPWGTFEQYAFNQPVTVSLMTVQPGQRLSLQAHTGRAELWIPANTRHRLAAIGSQPVRVLEVAFGNWQQADIQRFADDYTRPAQGE